jgi:hypothetical protein
VRAIINHPSPKPCLNKTADYTCSFSPSDANQTPKKKKYNRPNNDFVMTRLKDAGKKGEKNRGARNINQSKSCENRSFIKHFKSSENHFVNFLY